MSENKLQWMGLYPEELKAALAEMGEKPFRASQFFSWLHKGACFPEMTTLSLSLREKLAEKGIDQPVEIRDSACVGISYPGFYRDLDLLLK